MGQVKKYCRPIPILLTIKIKKTSKDFHKTLEIKATGTTAAAKPPNTTTGVSTITIPLEKLICDMVATTAMLKFQQEIISIQKRDI